jgi:hypothetical protein
MPEYGTWSPYAGTDAFLLAAVLLVIGGVWAYLGARLQRPVGVTRPGWVVGIILVVIWVLAILDFFVAAANYGIALVKQVGPFTPPASPVAPVTGLSGLVAFVVIVVMTRRHGWKIALGSGIVGSIAAPMIFELPFDLIVLARTYPPQPAALYTALFFLPLFIWEVSSYALVTLSPAAKVSRYTLFCLAAVFWVFAVWALFGFAYPSQPIPLALNAISKILCFVVAVSLFLPEGRARVEPSVSRVPAPGA